MKSKISYTKRDILVAISCVAFLLTTMGSISSTGRRRAKEAVCRSNLKRLGAVVHAFAKDNSGFLSEELAWDWPVVLEPYYQRNNLLLCPEATRPMSTIGSSYGNKFWAWADETDSGRFVGSYGLNQWVTVNTGGGRSWDRLWKTIYAAGGANVPLLLDAAGAGLTPLPQDTPPAYDGQTYFADPPNVDEIRSFCLNRHNAAVNGVFLDLSVNKIGLKFLWVQKWHREWPEDMDHLPLSWPMWMANFKDP